MRWQGCVQDDENARERSVREQCNCITNEEEHNKKERMKKGTLMIIITIQHNILTPQCVAVDTSKL